MSQKCLLQANGICQGCTIVDRDVFVACACQIRNKLNQEQNSKLQQQKELLNKRNMEVTLMDKRISELRDRLYKKKAEARQKENLPVRLGIHLTPRHKHALKVNLYQKWAEFGHRWNSEWKKNPQKIINAF